MMNMSPEDIDACEGFSAKLMREHRGIESLDHTRRRDLLVTLLITDLPFFTQEPIFASKRTAASCPAARVVNLSMTQHVIRIR